MFLQNKIINNSGRFFIVGDLHGNYDIFNYALKSLGFNSDDVIFSVGDLIDRGSQNIECMSFFLHTKNAYSVLGNHEYMAIKAIVYDSFSDEYDWVSNGGEWHKKHSRSYIKGLLESANNTFPYFINIEYNNMIIGICHAECPVSDWNDIKNHKFSDKIKKLSIWGRNNIKDDSSFVKNVDHLFHGHTIRKDPVNINNQHWIDNGVYADNGDNEYGLIISEIKNKKILHHRFNIDVFNPSGFSYK
jgi:serine/threonine protein phosphatase 1